jgi:hypothetical protein
MTIRAMVSSGVRIAMVVVSSPVLGREVEEDDLQIYRGLDDDLRVHADAVYLQKGNGLYLVCKHPDDSLVGWPIMSEERQRGELLRLQERLARGLPVQ